MKTYIGIDNGISGAVGILKEGATPEWFKMPTRSELNYTKKKSNITRVEFQDLLRMLRPFPSGETLVGLERPMVNPGRFQATISAVRALETTLVVLEYLGLPYRYIDSKEWQKTQLPSGLQKEQLKKASLDIGKRFWPYIKFNPDADAMLIARHLKSINA